MSIAAASYHWSMCHIIVSSTSCPSRRDCIQFLEAVSYCIASCRVMLLDTAMFLAALHRVAGAWGVPMVLVADVRGYTI